MYVWQKLIPKACLACCNEGTKKSLENILILQNRTGKNKPLPITTQTQLKQKIVFTSHATSFTSNHQSLQVTSVNFAGGGFRTGGDIRHISSTVNPNKQPPAGYSQVMMCFCPILSGRQIPSSCTKGRPVHHIRGAPDDPKRAPYESVNMTSNAIRGIRRKKSSLSEVKVAVIGAPAVGKSGK